jgi:hypothetical protein
MVQMCKVFNVEVEYTYDIRNSIPLTIPQYSRIWNNACEMAQNGTMDLSVGWVVELITEIRSKSLIRRIQIRDKECWGIYIINDRIDIPHIEIQWNNKAQSHFGSLSQDKVSFSFFHTLHTKIFDVLSYDKDAMRAYTKNIHKLTMPVNVVEGAVHETWLPNTNRNKM